MIITEVFKMFYLYIYLFISNQKEYNL